MQAAEGNRSRPRVRLSVGLRRRRIKMCPPSRGKNMNKLVSALLAAGLVVVASAPAAAQDLTITNAHIVVGNGTVIERGSIVVRGGRIVSVAAGAPASTSGQVIDANGMSAMAGFIDAHRHINTGSGREGADAAPARGRLHDDSVGRRPRRRQPYAARAHRVRGDQRAAGDSVGARFGLPVHAGQRGREPFAQ